MSELSALKAALAAEQAVVYGYGVAGAHLSGASRRYATDRLVAHETLRDELAALIAVAGAVPPPSLPAYSLPFPVADAASGRRLAAQLESGAAGAAYDLAAASAARSSARALAVSWLNDAAVSAARWGSPATPLPGRPA